MRKIILFIATSLDGFIAGPNGEIDWLFDDGDYGYSHFYDSIDTTLMGNETYKQVLTFGDFPYKEKENFVFTRNEKLNDNQFNKYISADISGFVKNLKNKKGKDIWLIGGGQINSIILNEDLIDEMIISIHPVLLGNGIPIFSKNAKQKTFRLTNYKQYTSGLTQVSYKK